MRTRMRSIGAIVFLLVSVAKLGARVPLLGQGGEPGPQATAGVVRITGEEPHQQQDSSRSHHPRGAVRHIPSSAEEGSFLLIF
jgi:hypothetical protein